MYQHNVRRIGWAFCWPVPGDLIKLLRMRQRPTKGMIIHEYRTTQKAMDPHHHVVGHLGRRHKIGSRRKTQYHLYIGRRSGLRRLALLWTEDPLDSSFGPNGGAGPAIYLDILESTVDDYEPLWTDLSDTIPDSGYFNFAEYGN